MSDLRDLKKSGALNKRARKYMVLEQDDTSDEESTSFDQAPIQHSSQTSVNDEENCPHYINTEDSSSDDDDVQDERARRIENMSLMDGIRYWALSTKQRHYSINIVLRLFQKANVRVPSDARTLLGTNTSPSTEIVEIGGGQFWYRGIKRCLTSQFR
uniref:Uncharacterized protein n=1 Tax=Anopheles atroparvus TaxID=41427 RepID=A0A182J1T4_ANOAO